MNSMRGILMVAVLTLGVIASAGAEDRSADISFSGTDIAAGVGFTWGDGTLHFNGNDYRFTLHGLSVADVGIAHIEGAGDVYNLQRVEDFSGNYVAVGAGATVAGGGDLAMLENQNGVRIQLHATTQGLKFNLSADGVRVALK